MNNWRAIGYIFLGWGSVFLILGLLVFFGIVSILSAAPIFGQVSILTSLAASAPWLVLASLLYVVGVVGYYAGRDAMETLDEVDMEEQMIRTFLDGIDSEWSIAIGALTTLAVVALQYFAGLMDISEIVTGIAWPIAISIIAGLIVGLVAFMILDKPNENEE